MYAVENAIIIYKTAAAVSSQAHKKLEQKALTCYECDRQGIEYNGNELYSSCAGEHHYLCNKHISKDIVCTTVADRKTGEAVLKCNGPGNCKSHAIFPPRKMHYKMQELNRSAHLAAKMQAEADEAARKAEAERDRERAIVMNEADNRVVAAETALREAEAAREQEKAAREQAEAIAAAATAANGQPQGVPRSRMNKQQVIDEEGIEAWEEKQALKKERTANNRLQKERNARNAEIVEILVPAMVSVLGGQANFDTWYTAQLAAKLAPAEAGSSSDGVETEQCDACDMEI